MSDWDSTLNLSDLEQQNGLPSGLLSNVLNTESSGDPNAVSPKGAVGLFQFMPETAKQYGIDPKDPEQSAQGAAKMFGELSKKYGGNINKMLAAYNWGQGNVDKHGINNAPEETQNYVSKITAGLQPNQQVAMSGLQDMANDRGLNTDKTPTPLPWTPSGSMPLPSQASNGIIDKIGNFIMPKAEAAEVDNNSNTPSAQDMADPLDKYRSPAAASTAKPQAEAADPLDKYRTPAAAASQSAAQKQKDLSSELGPIELAKLQQNNPTAYNNYMKNKANAAQSEASYGMGDVPRSLANVAASAAPEAFDTVVKAAVPAYAALTGQPQPTASDIVSAPSAAQTFKNALTERNQEFQQQYGNDPNAGINRMAGNAVAMTPAISGSGELIGAGANALTRFSPRIAQAVAESPVANFLSGKVASNAVVDPVSGAIVKNATVGNNLAQYAASGAKGAQLSLPVTALSNAGSEDSLDKQAAQNAAFGGIIGTGAPAFADVGSAAYNRLKNGAPSAAANAADTANNAFHNLVGGALKDLDTNEYVPGSKTTLAKAAAYGGDTNAGQAAALEKTLSESSQNSKDIYNPAFKQQEIDNNEARRKYALDLVGDPNDTAKIQSERAAEANKLIGNEAKRIADPTTPQGTVWSDPKNKPTDNQAALDYINQVRNGPASGNSGLSARLDSIEKLLKNPKAKNPQFVYESILKPQINDAIDSINPMDASRAKTSELPYLKQIKEVLGDAIQDAAPGFQPYRQAYTDASNKLDRQNALQSLKLVNPESDTSYPTLSRVNTALQKVQEGRQNLDPTNAFKKLSNDDVNKLQNLQKDLEREASAQNLLTTKGSPTSQNIQFVNKVKSALGVGKSDWPGRIGHAVGGAFGEGIGLASGHPYEVGLPLMAVGQDLGGRLGDKIATSVAAKKGEVANKLSAMLLDPKSYNGPITAAGNLSKGANVSRNPTTQNALSAAIPAGILGLRDEVVPTNSVPKSRNSQR